MDLTNKELIDKAYAFDFIARLASCEDQNGVKVFSLPQIIGEQDGLLESLQSMAKRQVRTIPLRWICPDHTQTRVTVATQALKHYRRIIEAGEEDKIPPMIIYGDGPPMWIGDGRHRYEAFRITGVKSAKAVVLKGGVREAILCSLRDNGPWGKRRGPADRRRAIARIMRDPQWSLWSPSKVGRAIGLTTEQVIAIKRVLSRRTITVEDDTSVAADIDEISDLRTVYTEIYHLLQMGINAVNAASRASSGGHLRRTLQDIRWKFSSLKADISGLTPSMWCPECKGSGCKECAKTGFITAAMVREASKKQVASVKEVEGKIEKYIC